MLKHKRIAGLAMLVGIFLSGCYQSPTQVTWHEPHEYKGAKDPLQNRLQDDGLHRQLAERFQTVQTDR